MVRILYALLAGPLGALVAAGLLLLSTGAPFFAPQAYADANDWFGLALLGDVELVLVSFAVLFALAAWTSDGMRTFGFMTAGFGLSFAPHGGRGLHLPAGAAVFDLERANLGGRALGRALGRLRARGARLGSQVPPSPCRPCAQALTSAAQNRIRQRHTHGFRGR